MEDNRNRPDLFQFVEHPHFTARIDQLRQQFARMNEVWESVSWTLVRNPYDGEQLYGEPSHYVFKTNPFDDIPVFWILYRLDEEKRQLHFISITQAFSDSPTN